MPPALPFFMRALRSGGKLAEGETIPRIEARLAATAADPGKLKGYREICGFPDSDKLPVTFPHIMAFPLHMSVLTNPKFPLKLLGLVHIRNLITQHRPLDLREPLNFRVYVDGHRVVHNGVEFDLVTEVQDVGGAVVWEGVSTNLSRRKSGEKKAGERKKPPEPAVMEFGRYASWEAPANIGRRYALNAGDFNPIHISAASAKLFGFPRAIAHGMWSLARCSAELTDELPKTKFSLSVAFKQPILLPSNVLMKYGPGANGVGFTLLSADAEKTHLVGQLTRL
jgi:hypothetical protein